MSREGSQLRLDPNRCDRCGRCERACTKGALKVGASYIYVDWRSCDSCMACVEVCDRGAIERKAGVKAGGGVATVDRGDPAPRPRTGKSGSPVDRSAPWTFLEAAAVLVTLFAGLIAMDAVLSLPAASRLGPSDHVLARVAALAAYYAVQLAVLVLLVRLRGRGLLDAVRLRAPEASWQARFASAGLTLLLTAGTLIAGFAYVIVAQQLGVVSSDETNVVQLFGNDATGFFLSVLLVVVIAPVAEEVVFRGVVLGAMAERWGIWTSITVTSVVFAMSHLNWTTLLPTMLLGVAAGWLAVRRPSLWPAITLHALYNLTLVAIVYAGA